MTQAQSSNGGLHHEDRDMDSPLPDSLTVHELAKALTDERAETQMAYKAFASSLQGLRNTIRDATATSERKHEATRLALVENAEATRALTTTVAALGVHVETLAKGLAPKAEVDALGKQMGRQALDGIAEGERQGAEIAATRADLATTRVELTRTKALAMVRKGTFALGVAVGTALALEWRWALKTLASLVGG